MNTSWVLSELTRNIGSFGIHSILSKAMYPRYTEFVVRDLNNNDCMHFRISLLSNGHYVMYIDSLLYRETEKACTTNPTNMIEWAKSHVGTLVSYIVLEDSSFVSLIGEDKNVSFSLTLIRKFFKHQGWYEKFGFRPTDPDWKYWTKRYDESFDNVRRLHFDTVCHFLWEFIHPFVLDDGKLEYTKLTDEVFEIWYQQLDSIIPHEKYFLEKVQDDLLPSYDTKSATEFLEHLYYNLHVYGYPTSLDNPCLSKCIKLRKESNNTLFEKWNPYFKQMSMVPKNTQDDVIMYFNMASATLNLFKKLGILLAPDTLMLRYPPL